MTTGIVVSCVFFPANQELRVEELSVVASSDFIDRRGVKIDEYGTRHIFATASFCKHGVELTRVVKSLSICIRAAILLEAMLEEIPGIVSILA